MDGKKETGKPASRYQIKLARRKKLAAGRFYLTAKGARLPLPLPVLIAAGM